jgi:hypothetical protein
MLAARLFAVTVYGQEQIRRGPHDPQILNMVKGLGASNKKVRECYETRAVIQRPWARYNGDGTWTGIHFASLL